ncbi:MAG TPA: CaiB/BaiF CoA-transferase family protein [Acidimicrobiales bacterium]|nr:CaiB/BaiF CoA-transferase family protein [Acidimicrobiales bacterium]HXZ63011.1 CaiB/BaiF CoA-transferase family protein [Acidimicrobiales bacterium]
MSGPLEHIRVLDLSRMYPGAMCTTLLADLGARITKVEAPKVGDGLRAMVAPGQPNPAHLSLNRGKRSVVLDLRHPEAADVLRRLVADADVVVESHRPRALDGAGLGFEAMRAVNPRLVWCSITGFGVTGPNANAPGHDLTYLGASGLLAKLADGDPTPPAAPLSLALAGSMATAAVLAALVEAQRTGRGRWVETSMTDVATWVLSEDVARVANAPGPGWGTVAGRNVYACRDGRHVTVCATESRTWATLCDALGTPDLAGHRLGVDEEAPATGRLAAVFATKPAADWLASPGYAGGVGPVHDVDALIDDPQITERGSLVTLDTGSTVLASPIRFPPSDGVAATLARAAPPDMGVDTDAVLSEAGYSAEEIAALRANGALG